MRAAASIPTGSADGPGELEHVSKPRLGSKWRIALRDTGRHARRHRRRIGLLVLPLVLPCTSTAAETTDHEPAVIFEIDAQDLGGALNAFALQSGREILFEENKVAGEDTEGIRGRYEPIAALERLLAEANLGYRVNELDTILVGITSSTMEREAMHIDNEKGPQVQRPSGFRRLANALAVAFAAGGTAIVGAAAGAEESSTDADERIEEVIVLGIRSSLEQSLERKRQADHFVDAITAEDIGAFPEQNLAEALQRIGLVPSRPGGPVALLTKTGDRKGRPYGFVPCERPKARLRRSHTDRSSQLKGNMPVSR